MVFSNFMAAEEAPTMNFTWSSSTTHLFCYSSQYARSSAFTVRVTVFVSFGWMAIRWNPFSSCRARSTNRTYTLQPGSLPETRPFRA